jgi:hypothetical protein
MVLRLRDRGRVGRRRHLLQNPSQKWLGFCVCIPRDPSAALLTPHRRAPPRQLFTRSSTRASRTGSPDGICSAICAASCSALRSTSSNPRTPTFSESISRAITIAPLDSPRADARFPSTRHIYGRSVISPDVSEFSSTVASSPHTPPRDRKLATRSSTAAANSAR